MLPSSMYTRVDCSASSLKTDDSCRMFVRGLQATYNAHSQRTGFRIPYGDILVFGLSCGQIMFAFLLSPETIPPEYNSWYVLPLAIDEFLH